MSVVAATEEKTVKDENCTEFDSILIDSIIRHLRYEALVKLSLTSQNVAEYINSKWFHVWFRAAMIFIESGATGVPDAGIITVDQLNNLEDLPKLDAGNATLCDWKAKGGDLHFPFDATFKLRISLLLNNEEGCRKRKRDTEFDKYCVCWQPLVVGIVPPLYLEVLLERKRVISVKRIEQKDSPRHIPQSLDSAFIYRPFAIDSLSYYMQKLVSCRRSERCESKTQNIFTHLQVDVNFCLKK